MDRATKAISLFQLMLKCGKNYNQIKFWSLKDIKVHPISLRLIIIPLLDEPRKEPMPSSGGGIFDTVFNQFQITLLSLVFCAAYGFKQVMIVG